MAPRLVSPSVGLPHEIWLEILVFCSDDLNSVISFGRTCSEYWNLLSKNGDVLWKAIIMKDYKSNPNTFKTTTLSILNCPIGTVEQRSEKLLNIIKTRTKYATKHRIVREGRKYQNFELFRFIDNLKIDSSVSNLIRGLKLKSLRYSPENVVQDIFCNSPLLFLSFAYCYKITDVIDAFYRKRNAHLQMDIKNRTMPSILYTLWKRKHNDPNPPSQTYFYTFIQKLGTTKVPSDTVLYLKFFFLECPNVTNNEDLISETGYEQEQHHKGIFKDQLTLLRDSFANDPSLVEGINLFEKELYGEC